MAENLTHNTKPILQPSGTFTAEVIADIQAKAELGRYRMRGFGTLRQRHWATFDDLTFIPATLTRIPLEGYRERNLLSKRWLRYLSVGFDDAAPLVRIS